MSKKTKQILDHSRGKTVGLQSAKGASLDVPSVPGGSQTGSPPADKRDAEIAEGDGGVLDFDEAFGLAAGGVECDTGRGGARAGF